MIELFFWLAAAFIVFTYTGYPVSLWFLQLLCDKKVKKARWAEWLTVTVVIAAKNEESNIRKRVINLMEQDYPKDRFEIVVVSDGSTDDTVGILRDIEIELESSPIAFKAIIKQKSSGKPSALNTGVMAAKGTILVFADARQMFSVTAIRELVSNFFDQKIGCVSGELEFVEDASPNLNVEMGAYWKYEKMIRKMESKSGSVVGATGAIYAIRKKIYKKLPTEILLDDVLTPLNVISQRFRVIFDESAKAYDSVSANVESEWRRKIRTLAGNWQLLSEKGLLKNAIKNRFIYRLFWHKFARLLVPYSLIILLISSMLAEGLIYQICAGLQLVFYLLAFFTHFFPLLKRLAVTKLCYFFCVLNVAAVVGFWVWFTGRSGDAWKPSRTPRD